MPNPILSIVLQVPPGTGALTTWANAAIIVIAVALLAVAFMAGLLMLRFNRILSELRRSAHQNFGPVSDRARSISDNVEFITQALRTDVEKLNASVRALSDRLHQASDRMEERIEEFNALMEVVQGEAEDIFLDTASTVRGVREGARAISQGPSGDRGRRPPIGAGMSDGPTPTDEVAAYPPGPSSRPDTPADQEADVVERAAPAADEEKAVRTGED